jgi:subtilisin-like proprotein convertase family protein
MDTIEGVTAIVPMNILDNAIIDKIIVNTDVSHTWPGDLTISLKAPESLNKEIVLFTSPCTGDGIANIQNVTIDDAGADLACSNSAPAISGTVAPENNMSIPFYGEDAIGVWELVLFDGYNGDGGQINAASITICDLKANTNLPSLQLSDIIVEMNTSYTFTSADMLATSSGERDNTQEYIIVSLPTKGRLEFNGIVLAPGDTFVQKDIKEGSVKYINLQTASFGDAFKVDILNAAKGWLPDNTVTIREATLSIDSNIIEGVSFWPNPVKNILNVKISNTDTEKVFISLFDLRGRKISQVSEAPLSGTFTKEINLESIASGVYLLNIQQGNKKTIKKIIVSN